MMEHSNRERTLDEIMEDTYSDPWDTQLIIKDGRVVLFRSKEGRTVRTEPYREEYGEIRFPDGFGELLANKTLEQQMEYFRIVGSRLYSQTAYGEITREQLSERSTRLQDCSELVSLVVKGRTLVGVRLRGWWKEGVILPSQCICTYYASDNEGSGTKDREDYAYLICFADR